MKHILYIPGLGDRYDGIRKIGLHLWRGSDVVVTHIPMRWSDKTETFEEKINRIKQTADLHLNAEVILVGESAGGAMALATKRRLGDTVSRVVTVCGMNRGAGNVNPRLYEKNPAFRDAMLVADETVARLTDVERATLLTIYSSADFTVRPTNTLIDGVSAIDIKTFGHMQAILAVLFRKYRLITES